MPGYEIAEPTSAIAQVGCGRSQPGSGVVPAVTASTKAVLPHRPRPRASRSDRMTIENFR